MQKLTRNILPAMAFLRSSLGGFAWICDGEFNLSSTCIQRTIIDVLNLLFALVFYICLVFGSIRKNRTTGQSGRDWITQCLSICCGLTSVAYFGAGLKNLIATNHGFRHLRWSVYFIRGLIWMTLTVSLHAQRSQIIKLLVSAWWVLFFLMVSALNIETLAIAVNIHISEVILWLVNFLIFFCALRNLWHFISPCGPDKGLSEPLLFDKAEENPSKLRTAGFFSRLSFSWINPLLSLGHSKPLVLEDIPCLVSEDEASLAYEKFTNSWQKLKSSNSSGNLVLSALVRIHLKEMIMLGTCAFLRTLSVSVAPLLLYAFINYANSDVKTTGNGLLLVGCLVVVKVVESVSYRYFFFNSRRTGMKMRSALMVAVYQKQLKLSSLGRRRHSTGEVVNYIAIDAYRMGEFPMWFNVGWTSFVQIFLAIGVLFGVVGLGALPGLAPLALFGLLNVPFARLLQKCQSEFMIAQDKRLRATSEILNGMKIIKLQAWEENFKHVIQSYRDYEFKWLSEAQHKKVFGTVLYWISPTIVSSVIFAGCALFRSAALDASTIFTILAALRSMAEPVRMLPEALSALIQAKVSFDRIDSFLLDDELQSSRTNKTQFLDLEDSVCIRTNNGYFSWDPQSAIPTLRNVYLQIKMGQKIAVCGPVGAGKSSLLYALLGEIPNVSGAVEVIGSTAYVSQTAWIQSGTICDNILFGKPMDKTKYEKTIKACALYKDIKSFPHGDLTEIGQRGLNMSGGQRQRIQLARAVYNDADIYLLDDPFSAVDAHTAAILFNECVMGALESKTVILVTHQVEFLSEVDMILVVEAGQITQSGSYEELLTAGTAFEQLVNAHKSSITDLDSSAAGSRMEPQEGMSLNQLEETGEGEISTNPLPGVQLTEEEEKEIGNVGWKPFYDYILISKGLLFLALKVFAQSGFVFLQAVSGYWLAFAIQIPNISSPVLIGVYAAISALSAVFVHLRSLYATLLGLRASKSFFTGLTNSIFNAPMLFFDSTPVGRILTRYSSDLSVLDYDIPFSCAYSLAALIELLGTIVVMASVTWPVLIVAALAFLASNYVQSYYQASARELVRINGTTKAPVMSYAAETSLGVATIRAYNMAERFFQNNLRLVDTDAKLFLYSSAAMEWLILRIEALQNLTLFTAAFLLVLIPKGYVPPGLMGLSLSYALALTGTQVFMSRWYSSLCNYIISVERIKQFMHIPSEPPAIVENNRPPLSWPTMGRIELHDLKIKYRPNAPLVLKGITCTFREGTRVGVVGRTGSGKTTLISALFRLVEPYSGNILVDGLDICSIGLKDLRMKLSIIPQEPTLFRGSIRTNLDPLGLYSDEEIWKALEKCQLREIISKLPNLLDSSVSDEGENWSAGQRQLFCLGRVLLKRNRILVLDEATASIDSITDSILQKVIREEFSNCTVITVAHRVPTVIDSDMVMVLSFGTLTEYDEPTKLMQTNSSFAKLVAEYWSSRRRNSV